MNPPISGPEKGWPEIPRLRTIGMERAKWGQLELLSPVQVAPYLCPPRKFALERRNGLFVGFAFIIPSLLARIIIIPYTL